MKKNCLLIGMMLLLGGVALGDDLVTAGGATYRNYQIKKIGASALTIAYLNDKGEPDIADIPFAELPDSIRKYYPSAPQSAPDAQTVPAGQAGRPGLQSKAGLESDLHTLGTNLAAELAKLAPNDKSGRAALAAQVRAMLTRMLPQYAQEADFMFVTMDGSGVLIKVVGTPSGSQLKSNSFLYVYGAERPAYRAFHSTLYPGGRSIAYSTYGVVPVYAVTVDDAIEVAVDWLGGFVGDPMLFTPAAAPAAASDTQSAATAGSSTSNVTNVYYTNSDNQPDWWWGNGYIGYWNGRPWPHPHPDPPPRPRPTPREPDRPDSPSMVKPERSTPLPRTSGSTGGRTTNYGLMPEWAIPRR